MSNRRKFLGQVAAAGLTPLLPATLSSGCTSGTTEKKDAATTGNRAAAGVTTGSESQEWPVPEGFKGKNKVGFNLLLWASAVSEKMNPIADRLKTIGFDGIEVSMGATDIAPYVTYGKYLQSIGMEATCSFGVGPDHNPISESKAVRDKAVEKMKWIIDRANDLHAKVVCGPMHSAFLDFRQRGPSEDEYQRSAEVLRQAGEYAATTGVVFAVEAINRFECYLCNTTDQLNKLIRLTDHPNIRPMYDTFHSNIEDKSMTAAIESLKGSLAHVHVCENDRGTPGSGHMPFDPVFAALAKIGYDGWLTIESFSRNDEGFANAMKVWREFSPEWDIPTKGLKMIRSMQSKHGL